MGSRLRATLAFLLLLAALSPGCARVASLPARTPELPLEPWERTLAAQKAAPTERSALGNEPNALAKTAAPLSARPAATPSPTARTASSAVRGGTACLTELAARGVPYERSDPVLGIATPIVVKGPIGSVRFYTLEKKAFVVDCRLALALSEIAPDLHALGIVEARYSGAYVYRTSHPGRMSLHAYGLAIDLHEFKVNGEGLLVKKAFEKGRGCSSELPLLNQLACRVRERRLFHEQIGPDDNAAHHDHFHLGLRPLPDEVAADLPWPAAPPARRRSKSAVAHPGSLPEVVPNGSRNVSARARSAPAPRAR